LRRVAIVALLVALACRKPDYAPAMRAAITQLRSEIATYYAKNHRYPQSLNELPAIPVDPITHSKTTWRTTVQENVRVDDFSSVAPPPSSPQIVDAHSGAPGTDLNGRAWSDY